MIIQIYFIVAARYLPIWVHGWLGKNQWTNIIRERRFLHTSKHGRLYLSRFHKEKWFINDSEIWFEYHNLYVQSNTLLLADIFSNFQNMHWNIWTWCCSISFHNRISMASNLRKDQSKIRSINWYWHALTGRKRYWRWDMSYY